RSRLRGAPNPSPSWGGSWEAPMKDACSITLALGGKWHGKYGQARCPAHDDAAPYACRSSKVLAASAMTLLSTTENGTATVPFATSGTENGKKNKGDQMMKSGLAPRRGFEPLFPA